MRFGHFTGTVIIFHFPPDVPALPAVSRLSTMHLSITNPRQRGYSFISFHSLAAYPNDVYIKCS